jgi:hypothetical protein
MSAQSHPAWLFGDKAAPAASGGYLAMAQASRGDWEQRVRRARQLGFGNWHRPARAIGALRLIRLLCVRFFKRQVVVRATPRLRA